MLEEYVKRLCFRIYNILLEMVFLNGFFSFFSLIKKKKKRKSPSAQGHGKAPMPSEQWATHSGLVERDIGGQTRPRRR